MQSIALPRCRPPQAARTAIVAGLLATTVVAAVAAVATGAVQVPNLATALSDASRSLGAWAYLLVPGLAFLETGAFVGLLVPGETAVIAGGVAAAGGHLSLPLLVALVWAGALLGDVLSFYLGRRLGRPFLDAHAAKLRITPERRAQAESFFERHGGRAILLGRFVGLLRALTPFIAGTSGIALRRVLPYIVVGTLAWATAFTLLGYAFADSFERAGETAGQIALGLVAVIALAVAAKLVRTRRAGGLPAGT